MPDSFFFFFPSVDFNHHFAQSTFYSSTFLKDHVTGEI